MVTGGDVFFVESTGATLVESCAFAATRHNNPIEEKQIFLNIAVDFKVK